jgi:hypothetical protein
LKDASHPARLRGLGNFTSRGFFAAGRNVNEKTTIHVARKWLLILEIPLSNT